MSTNNGEKKLTLAEKLAARKHNTAAEVLTTAGVELKVPERRELEAGEGDVQPLAEVVSPERAAVVAADIVAIAQAQEDLINPRLETSSGAPAEPLPEAVLPKKTRKKKAETEASLLTPAEDEAIKEAAQTAFPGPETVPADRPIRVLFLNAMPLYQNKGLLFAHTLIAKAAETVQNDAQVPHVKMIPYSQGGPALAAQLAADIKQMTPGFDLVLLAKNPEGRDVEQVLCALAETVIVGV